MALNDSPCGKCTNYDPLVLGDGTRKTKHGWCAAKSVYPHTEQHDQIFPVGVKRAAVGELAKPIIVKIDEIVGHCTLVRRAKE